jgi:hypothetical protein
VRWLLAILVLCGLLAWIPWPAEAAVNIGITAQGNQPGALPGAPTDFDAVLASNYQVDITWVKGINATHTLIRGKIGEYPADRTDGYEVYFGTGTSVTDWVDLTATDEPVYYRAWAWNITGYSNTYAQDFVEGGGVGMADALILIPILGLLGGLTVIGDRNRNWLVIIIAVLGWFLMAGWSMTTSDETWDAYWIIAILSVMIALVTAVWPLVNRPHELPKEDELTEEDRAWGGKRRRSKKWQGE